MSCVFRCRPRITEAGIKIPGVNWDDVRGEQVNLLQRIVPRLPEVGFELTGISGAGAVCSGFHLHAEEMWPPINANIPGGVSPRFGHVEACSAACAINSSS